MAAKKTTHDSPPAPAMTPEALSALAERLVGHAESIRNPAAAKAMGDDMREAARVIAEWRVGIQEVIEHTHDDAARARLSKLVGGV